jgi:hypothetical protein
MGKLGLKIPKGAFKRAKEALSDDFNELVIDPGQYNAQVVDVRTHDGDKGQQVIIDIFVPEGNEGRGGKQGMFYSMDDDRLKWLIKDLRKLGYDASESEAHIEATLETLQNDKPTIRCKVRMKDGYQNISIVKLLASDGNESAADTDALGGKAGMAEAIQAAVKTSAKAGAAKAAAAKAAAKAAPAEEEISDVDAPAEEEISDGDAPAAQEDTVVIQAGLKCNATLQGKSGVAVEIVSVDEESSTCVVLDIKSKKKFKISVEKLSLE